jgi:hypothetical protein
MLCPSCSKEIIDGSIFCNLCGKKMAMTTVQKAHTTKMWGLLVLILVAFAGWHLFEIGYGSNQASRTLSAAVRLPITLADKVENLPASSWKAVTLDVPYDGLIGVQVRILRGNPVDIFVVGADQSDLIRKADWKNVRVSPDFNAAKTTTFRRSGRLSKGVYYLILRDPSLGILSASTTDIDVKINLNP